MLLALSLKLVRTADDSNRHTVLQKNEISTIQICVGCVLGLEGFRAQHLVLLLEVVFATITPLACAA